MSTLTDLIELAKSLETAESQTDLADAKEDLIRAVRVEQGSNHLLYNPRSEARLQDQVLHEWCELARVALDTTGGGLSYYKHLQPAIFEGKLYTMAGRVALDGKKGGTQSLAAAAYKVASDKAEEFKHTDSRHLWARLQDKAARVLVLVTFS